jgi:hypothetical protein
MAWCSSQDRGEAHWNKVNYPAALLIRHSRLFGFGDMRVAARKPNLEGDGMLSSRSELCFPQDSRREHRGSHVSRWYTWEAGFDIAQN